MLGIQAIPGYLLAAFCTVTTVAVLLRITRDSTIKLALEQFDALDPKTSRYRFDGVGITERSSVGLAHLQWPAFAGHLETERFLLVLRRPADAGQFIAFPVEQLPDAAKLLTLERLGPEEFGSPSSRKSRLRN